MIQNNINRLKKKTSIRRKMKIVDEFCYNEGEMKHTNLFSFAGIDFHSIITHFNTVKWLLTN
jgi:hypothetical protein